MSTVNDRCDRNQWVHYELREVGEERMVWTEMARQRDLRFFRESRPLKANSLNREAVGQQNLDRPPPSEMAGQEGGPTGQRERDGVFF